VKAFIGAVIAILAVAAPAMPAIASAAPSSGCSATTGVTVIVDFTYFPGGRVERGCAPGLPANGLIALHDAGFTSAGTEQYGDAFVCRIDGLPSPQQDACAVTPSPNAYWAFWNARPSDTQWTYASVGVLDFHPRAGSIEAFAFGKNAEPSISPSAAIPPPPTSTTTTVAPPTTRPPPVTAATSPTGPTPTTAPVIPLEPTTTPAPATPTSTAKSKPKSTPRSSTSTSPTTRTPRSTSSTVRIVDRSAAGPVARHDSSGSPLGVILAIVIVAGLGGGAFAFTRARRHQPA
jgi:hypothetical protein